MKSKMSVIIISALLINLSGCKYSQVKYVDVEPTVSIVYVTLSPAPVVKPAPTPTPVPETSAPYITPNIVDAYEMVIDELYNKDTGLNTGGIIDIDTSQMVNITEEGKRDLLQRVSKYGKTIKNLTYNELIEEGYIKKGNLGYQFENGFIIAIKDKPFEKDFFTLEAEKWVSGIGAYMIEATMEYKNNKWNLKIEGWAIS